MLKIVTEIINIDINDGALLKLDDINLIREEDEYGGYRVSLTVNIDSMRESFHFDVATGDPITPKEISYKYQSLIDRKTIRILVYNLETVLAEKLETILIRGESSSRMKDYHDVYLIMTLKYDELNLEHLRKAITKTFGKRKFNGNLEEFFSDIKDSLILENKWLSYCKKKRIYDIKFIDTLNSVGKLIDIVMTVEI